MCVCACACACIHEPESAFRPGRYYIVPGYLHEPIGNKQCYDWFYARFLVGGNHEYHQKNKRYNIGEHSLFCQKYVYGAEEGDEREEEGES